MKLPTWVSLPGLAAHAAVGLVMTAIVLFVAPPLNAIAAALFAGLIHEQGSGFDDFTTAPGAPLNGILDLVAFVLPALVCGGLWLLW